MCMYIVNSVATFFGARMSFCHGLQTNVPTSGKFDDFFAQPVTSSSPDVEDKSTAEDAIVAQSWLVFKPDNGILLFT